MNESGITRQAGQDLTADTGTAEARVTLIVSSLTDDRRVTRFLDALGWAYKREQWSMASSTDREAFQELQQQTGWKTLPMIFLDGKFIGGIDELFSHPAIKDADNRAAMHMKTWARRLGYAGLLPFAAGALGVMLLNGTASAWMLDALLAYAAVILSFIGALHWATSITRDDSQPLELMISVMPALLGWVALLMPVMYASPVVLLGFVLIYLYDRSSWSGLAWFVKLRKHLTIGATLSISAAWLAGT